MQYIALIYVGPPNGSVSPEAAAAVSAEYFALSDDPICVGGAQLEPAQLATTIRSVDGQALVTDGPFAETKEVLGGYYLLEADDLDAALQFAARIPATRMGGAVEVRPLTAG
ncbi:MAG TPA: YciI family protein [Solirubrobacteraceae bacterium]|nr:YciI family protein [Solirubrobacteraceae bacterium]